MAPETDTPMDEQRFKPMLELTNKPLHALSVRPGPRTGSSLKRVEGG